LPFAHFLSDLLSFIVADLSLAENFKKISVALFTCCGFVRRRCGVDGVGFVAWSTIVLGRLQDTQWRVHCSTVSYPVRHSVQLQRTAERCHRTTTSTPTIIS